MWAELPELLMHIINWKTIFCVCTWLKFHELIKASIWTWQSIQGMNVYKQQRCIYHFCWYSYSNIWASWFFCPLQSFLLSDTTLAVACPSLLPPLAFPHQIFCSRTTAAPFLQSSPLIHTTDILAHRLVSLSLSLPHTTCTPNSPSLGHFSIECPSIYHRSRGPLLLLYRQTDSEGGTVQIINLTTSSDFTLQKMLLQVKVLY